MQFDLFIGIDYSGAKTPVSRSKALQVYASRRGEEPFRVSRHRRPTNHTAIGVGVRSRIGWWIDSSGHNLHSRNRSWVFVSAQLLQTVQT